MSGDGRRPPRGFGGNVSLRVKLLLLTLIPLVPLGIMNVYSLFYLDSLASRDLEHRISRLGHVWRERVEGLEALAGRTCTSMAEDKRVEQALVRNHWGLGREILLTAVLADQDLRAILVDGDGRVLADSGSEAFDEPVSGLRVPAAALRGHRSQGLVTFDGRPFWGVAAPVEVVGGVEGAVWVGFHLDTALVEHFEAKAGCRVAMTLPGGGVVSTIPGFGVPERAGGFDLPVDGAIHRFMEARVRLLGLDEPVTTYVGVDHTDLASAVREQLYVLAMVFGGLLVLILGTTITISNRIVSALRFVVEKMRLLQEGEYQRIDPVVGRDEIAYLGHGFNEMINGLIERDFVREIFGRYMSKEVARAVLDNPEGLEMGGEERVVTILMCDLRGFTSFSGEHRPEEVVRVLNTWLGRMADVIVQYHGTINEFLGDAILALFGAPVRREDDPLRAVACAVAMQRAMAHVNERLAAEGIPPLHMGIGLATGVVVAGNIGSEKRVKYGVVGQPVNLASRVESFTVGDDVLLDQATLEGCRGVVHTGPARRVRVKGSEEPITIYPVLEVGEPYHLRLPAADAPEDTRVPSPGAGSVDLWPIRGKEVSEEPLVGEIVSLGEQSVEVSLAVPLDAWCDVKLRPRLPLGDATSGMYGKVVQIGSAAGAYRAVIRITRVSTDDARLIARQVSAWSGEGR